jgi:ABC-2 type transport system permease protein
MMMMALRDVLLVSFTDLKLMLRARETVVWMFVMPIIFIYFLSAVNRGPAPASSDNRDALAVSLPPDAGFVAEHVITRLEQRDFRIVRVKSAAELDRYRRRLVFPSGFSEDVTHGRPAAVRFERLGGGRNTDFDRTRVMRAVYTGLADFGLADIEKPAGAAAVTPDALKAVASRPHLITVDVAMAGKRLDPPSGLEQAIPGTIVMFTLLVSFTTGAITLMIQRDRGILRRMASTPMARASIVAGKWGSHWLLAVAQVAWAMVVARVMFGLHWGPNLLAILGVLICYTALAASLGMALGNFLNRERQVIGAGVILSNLLGALGGCWWPTEVTPLWAQKLAMALPSGWAMNAIHKLLSFGLPASTVMGEVAAMLLVTVVTLWIVARRFRFA